MFVLKLLCLNDNKLDIVAIDVGTFGFDDDDNALLSFINLDHYYSLTGDLIHCGFTYILSHKEDKIFETLEDALTYGKQLNEEPMLVPTAGSFKAYKIGYLEDDYQTACLCELCIPEDAERVSPNSFVSTGKKCRANKAEVISIHPIYNNKEVIWEENYTTALSPYRKQKYIVGETVVADSFDDDRFKECTNGIHFFMTVEDAIGYIDEL